MELTLPRLLLFLIIVAFLGDYAFDWQADREETLQRQEELKLFERQSKVLNGTD